jgi:predicted RNase H-like nuclease (RuvC/YqgF family)
MIIITSSFLSYLGLKLIDLWLHSERLWNNIDYILRAAVTHEDGGEGGGILTYEDLKAILNEKEKADEGERQTERDKLAHKIEEQRKIHHETKMENAALKDELKEEAAHTSRLKKALEQLRSETKKAVEEEAASGEVKLKAARDMVAELRAGIGKLSAEVEAKDAFIKELQANGGGGSGSGGSGGGGASSAELKLAQSQVEQLNKRIAEMEQALAVIITL